MPVTIRHFYEFGDFRLDADKHRLLRAGEVVPLSPQAIVVQPAIARRLPVFVRRHATALFLAAMALSALTPGAVLFFRSERKATPDLAAIRSISSIAVLPPRALSGKTDDAPLSLGVA